MGLRTLNIRTANQSATDYISERFGNTDALFDTWARPKYGKVHPKKDYNLDDPFYADMPPFVSRKVEPFALFKVDTDFSNEKLSELLDQPITDKTKSVWYPQLDRTLGDFAWVSDSNLRPRCPIYIISKGRPNCITAASLDRLGADYQIVVEPSEMALYQERWGDRVVTGDFDVNSGCSIPVRNFVNDELADHDRYWLMDDNIEEFYIMNDNTKYVSRTDTMFRVVEDFSARFINVGQAGLNYHSFAKKTDPVPPYYLNTRIYSCTLMYKNLEGVRDDNGQMWRGRFNEDTDLSLRILKAGYNTILMNGFLAGKVTTQRVRGGNTDSVYLDGDDRLGFAKSLQEQHPDCVEVVKKFGRWHHNVDYRRFNRRLVIDDDYEKTEYGLRVDPNGRNQVEEKISE